MLRQAKKNECALRLIRNVSLPHLMHTVHAALSTPSRLCLCRPTQLPFGHLSEIMRKNFLLVFTLLVTTCAAQNWKNIKVSIRILQIHSVGKNIYFLPIKV